MHCGIKVNLKTLMTESSHASYLQLNKLVVAMKISAAFEYNSTINYSADTNLDTVRFYQESSQLKLLPSSLAALGVYRRFNRNRQGKYTVAVEIIRQEKRKFERKMKI